MFFFFKNRNTLQQIIL
uniref:Uncharacterized protein n=1 Tax=Anguilla anguilla TaxID=7936 RepID=A0A0E9RTC5_ANGAN